VVKPFIETRGVCVMPSGHALAGEGVIRPGMLDGQPVISLAPDDTARLQFDAALAAAGARPRVVVETQFAATICQLALEGAGVGLTNSLTYVSDRFEPLGLVAKPFEPAIAFRSLMILPPHRARSRLVDELVSLLEHDRDELSRACEARFGRFAAA